MRAKDKIYHIQCFRCVTCQRQLIPGDEFALRENNLFCKAHHDVFSPGDVMGKNLFFFSLNTLYCWYNDGASNRRYYLNVVLRFGSKSIDYYASDDKAFDTNFELDAFTSTYLHLNHFWKPQNFLNKKLNYLHSNSTTKRFWNRKHFFTENKGFWFFYRFVK